MTTETVTCPYCNAYVAVGQPGAELVLCPRCGEMFPYRPRDTDREPAGPVPQAVPAPAPAASPPRWSNGAVAAVVLAVMVLVTTVALTFSLLTVQARRDYVPNPQHPPERIADTLKANPWIVALAGTWVLGLVFLLVKERLGPAEDPRSQRLIIELLIVSALGLGLFGLSFAFSNRRPGPNNTVAGPPTLPGTALDYLPPDLNFLAVVRVRDALQTVAGKQIREALPLGPADHGTERVQGKTGLEPDNLDALVVALKADHGQVRPTVLLQTRQPFDRATVRQAFHLSDPLQRNGRTLYKGVPEKLHFGVVVWFPSDTVAVIAPTAEDLDHVPLTPSWNPDRLAPPLRALVQERLGSKAPAWAVGSAEAAKPLLPAFAAKEREILGKVTTFDISVQLGKDVLLKAALDCADETAARAVADYLQHVRVGAAELSETQQGRRVTVELRADVDAIRKASGNQ